MKHSFTGTVVLTAVTAVVATLTAGSGLAAPAQAGLVSQRDPGTRGPDARLLRSIYTHEFGVSHPRGVAWDPGRRELLVVGAATHGSTPVVAITPAEQRRGRVVLRSSQPGAAAAFDPRTHRLTTGTAGVSAVAGSAYSPDGTKFLLDASTNSIVRVGPDGSTGRLRLRGLAGATLRGLAYEPNQRRLYVADTSKHLLYGLDGAGTVVRRQDLSGVGIRNLQDMTFAPSGDPTDAPTEQSLYVADAGAAGSLGRIAEVSLLPAATVAAAATVTPTIRTVDTSAWSPSSPDPAGITYLPGADRLLVSDSEVDEMSLYSGANLYQATRDGTLHATGTTLPPGAVWSREPTGVAFNSGNGHLFVSDDDLRVFFEISSAGADGVFGTADDGGHTKVSTTAFGMTDTEDVGYDSKRGQLLFMDGLGDELYRLDPGRNNVFDGVAPAGDDVATHTDLERLGIVDPEGVTYDSVRDTVVVADNQALWELDTNGSLMNTIDMSGANPGRIAGVTVAPASDGSGQRHYYVVDRMIDNDNHPLENDGRLYEVAANLAPASNRPPTANAGADQSIDISQSAQLAGSGTDDGRPAPLTYSWSTVSGPGSVSFGSSSAARTTATFSAAGGYVLRLTVSDSQYTATDEMRVDVYALGAPRTARVPVAVSSDDAQEGGGTTGTRVRVDSPDDELGNDGTLPVKPLVTGLRFAGLPVPAGSEIISARIQFAVDEVGSEPTSYTIAGEAADHAATYTTKRGSISSRATTTHKVAWSAPPWTAVGDRGPAQLTPDLRDVLQEIVARPGWRTGGAAAFMISGTGRRTAGARDGRAGVPVLVVEYRTDLSLRSSVARAVAGDRVRVFGTTRSSDSSPAAGEAVAIYAYRAPGDAKVLVGRVVSGADGSFAVYDRPRTNTRYVAEVGSLRSRLVPVAVRPRLSAHFVDPTLVKGRTAVVTGLVRPAAAGQPLTLQVWTARHWRAVATRSQAAGSTRFQFRLTRLGVGRHTYRVVAPAYAGRSQAVTAAMRVTVRRA